MPLKLYKSFSIIIFIYLTCTHIVTEAQSAHHTLLPNMYHENRGRFSAHHTLLSNMYQDNRGRLSAHHTLLPNMYQR